MLGSMSNPSFAQENYLKSLYLLGNGSTRFVRTAELSAYIKTRPASVSDMLQKLDKQALVRHEKYKGAQLSRKGRAKALDVIRRHRLWEVFLYEKLSIDAQKVHALAEELEHLADQELTAQLANYLGHPTHDPHGACIPAVDGRIVKDDRQLLCRLKKGEGGRLVALCQGEKAALQHLSSIGLAIGNVIQVKDRSDYDESVTIYVGKGKAQKELHLSQKLAQNLYVKKEKA